MIESMATVIEIGSLISRRPDIRGGRPCIAGTGVSVRRIAQWHNMGQIPQEIVETFGGHLSLAQVHAALAYYYANQAEIDTDLEAEARETESLEQQHRRGSASVSQVKIYIDEGSETIPRPEFEVPLASRSGRFRSP